MPEDPFVAIDAGIGLSAIAKSLIDLAMEERTSRDLAAARAFGGVDAVAMPRSRPAVADLHRAANARRKNEQRFGNDDQANSHVAR